jgi:cytochrome c1
MDDPGVATSPEMLATIINYLNWQAERRQAQSRRR